MLSDDGLDGLWHDLISICAACVDSQEFRGELMQVGRERLRRHMARNGRIPCMIIDFQSRRRARDASAI